MQINTLLLETEAQRIRARRPPIVLPSIRNRSIATLVYSSPRMLLSLLNRYEDPFNVVWPHILQRFLEHPWPTCFVLRMHLLKDSNYRPQYHLPNPLAAAHGEN